MFRVYFKNTIEHVSITYINVKAINETDACAKVMAYYYDRIIEKVEKIS